MSSGLSIVFDKLPVYKYILIVVSSIGYSVSLYELEEFTLSTNADTNMIATWISLGFFVLFYLMFFFVCFFFSSDSLRALKTHLQLILERGIDPVTTPSYRKVNLLKFTRFISLIIFFCIAIIFCISLFVKNILPSWLIVLIQSLFQIFLFVSLTYKFRIRVAMSATYGDDENDYVVANYQLKEYNDDMVLPPIPQQTNNRINV